MRRFLLPALAAAVIGTAGTITLAQTATAPAGHPGWHRPDPAMIAQMQKRRADDIALLIGLTPAQRPSLDQMLAAMKPPHHGWGDKDGDAGRPPMPPQDEGFAAKLDHMSAGIDARAAAEKAKLETVKRFYAGLTSDQKLRFDALERLKHGDHDRGMRGRGGPGGPGGPGMMPPQG